MHGESCSGNDSSIYNLMYVHGENWQQYDTIWQFLHQLTIIDPATITLMPNALYVAIIPRIASASRMIIACEVPGSTLLAAAVVPLDKALYPHFLVPRKGLKAVDPLVACL